MQVKNVVQALAMAAAMTVAVSGTALAFGDGKFKAEVEREQIAVGLLNQVRGGDYKVVTTGELKQWIDSGKEMVIVDTMPYEASYVKEHVPGAKQFLFPIPEMDQWQSEETDDKSQADYEALLGPDKNKTIVIYCGFVKCTRSHNGALWARKLGYTDVYRYPGGIFAWKGADYPTEQVE
jgi:thiosulfate/3-mercaptopyruvate sulfurtransferase